MVVDYITNVREHQVLKYAVLQVFQESVESDNKFSELAENCAQACWTIKNKLYIPVPVSSSTSDLAALHIIKHIGVSVFSLSPFTLFFPSPLADFTDPQDVGEEGLPVSDDHRLFQLPALHEMFSQNMKRSQVRGLWCQDLKHTLSGRRWTKLHIKGNQDDTKSRITAVFMFIEEIFMIYIWFFFLNKKSYTGCEGLLGAIYKQLKSKIIISNNCMDVSANIWKNTQTVTLRSEETDKQEPPRNHQGSSLWGTGNCWTPASCPQWSQFHHELRGCRPRNMFPLQNQAQLKFTNTWIIHRDQDWTIWPRWQEECLE